jgi:quercetin dioxygenase-like cupin family protein
VTFSSSTFIDTMQEETMQQPEFKALLPGEARAVSAVGMIYTFTIMGDETAGAYSITEITVSPEIGPPMHRHPGLEAFYVLDGTFHFQVGEQSITGTTGTFVSIPPMIFHVWKNVGSTLGKVLCLMNPAGMEKMFLEAGHPVTDKAAPPVPPTPADIQREIALAAKYGIEVQLPTSQTPGASPDEANAQKG